MSQNCLSVRFLHLFKKLAVATVLAFALIGVWQAVLAFTPAANWPMLVTGLAGMAGAFPARPVSMTNQRPVIGFFMAELSYLMLLTIFPASVINASVLSFLFLIGFECDAIAMRLNRGASLLFAAKAGDKRRDKLIPAGHRDTMLRIRDIWARRIALVLIAKFLLSAAFT